MPAYFWGGSARVNYSYRLLLSAQRLLRELAVRQPGFQFASFTFQHGPFVLQISHLRHRCVDQFALSGRRFCRRVYFLSELLNHLETRNDIRKVVLFFLTFTQYNTLLNNIYIYIQCYINIIHIKWTCVDIILICLIQRWYGGLRSQSV